MTGLPRRPFTTKEESFLAQYIAKYNPDGTHRSGNALWQRLVDNADGLWPWAKNHTFHSWRDRYIANKPRFDRMIEKHIRSKASAVKEEGTAGQSQPRRSSQPPKRGTPTGRGRRVQKAKVYSQPKTAFTEDEKYLLAQYLAEVHPEKKGRLGFAAYTALMENKEKYPWGQRHTWSSWHGRYKKNLEWYDNLIEEILAGRSTPTWILRGDPEPVLEDIPTKKRARSEDTPKVAKVVKKRRVQPSLPKVKPVAVAYPHKEEEDSDRLSPESEEGAPKLPVQESPPSEDYSGEIFDRSDDEGDEEGDDGEEADDATGDSQEAAEILVQMEAESRLSDSDVHESSPRPLQDQESASVAETASMRSVSPDPSPSANSASDLPARAENLQYPDESPIVEDIAMEVQRITQGPTPPTSDAHRSSPLLPERRSPELPADTHREGIQAPVSYERSRRHTDDEIFGSPSSDADIKASLVLRKPPREPPVLETSHNSAFTDARGRSRFDSGARRMSGVEQDMHDPGSVGRLQQAQWPPARRGRKSQQSPPDANRVRSTSRVRKNSGASPHSSRSQLPGPSHFQMHEETIDLSDTEDTPSDPLPERCHPSAQLAHHQAQHVVALHPFSQPSQSQVAWTHAPHHVVYPVYVQAQVPVAISPADKLNQALVRLASANGHHGSEQGSGHYPAAYPPGFAPTATVVLPATPAHVSVSRSRAHHTVQAQPTGSAPATSLSMVSSVPQALQPSPPVLNRQQALESSPSTRPRPTGSSTPPPAGASGSPLAHPLSTAEEVMVFQLGMQEALRRMAMNHGFQYAVALNAYEQMGSFRGADNMLREMREAAQKQAEKIAHRRQSMHDDEERTGDSSSKVATRQLTSSEYDLLELHKHVANGRPSTLEYTPVSMDAGQDSQYRPPEDSRAGSYAKLVEEGRYEDAKRRDDQRRRSGIMPDASPFKKI